MSTPELNQLIDQSLVLYLREVAFPTRGWTFNVTNELLQPYTNPETNQMEYGHFSAQYKNWTYYSSGVSGVTVPATFSPSTGVEYINYVDGFVSYSGTVPTANQPPLATYSVNSVSVIDGYPEFDNFESYQLPIVAVDFEGLTREPLQIGGGYFMHRQYALEIFARDDSERDQMVQVLTDSLKYNFPVLNFEVTGYPLLFNGDRNTSYTRSTASQSGVINFARVTELTVKTIRVPDAIERMRHRSQVMINVRITE